MTDWASPTPQPPKPLLPGMGLTCLADAGEVLVENHILYGTANVHRGRPRDPQGADHIIQAPLVQVDSVILQRLGYQAVVRPVDPVQVGLGVAIRRLAGESEFLA